MAIWTLAIAADFSVAVFVAKEREKVFKGAPKCKKFSVFFAALVDVF